ncbi:hypothetical protein QR685DRAFT_263917 [Neurospora intermedia]|uniref:Uncharacterized protein n=1 Tax=Neurospora intermedia TaxID=5142 RepID=A0ABR3DER2_NEUIN
MGIFGARSGQEELVIVGRHGKTRTKIVTASSQPLRTFLVVLGTQLGRRCRLMILLLLPGQASFRSSSRGFRIASHLTCPGTLAYRTPAVLNHHDRCNVRSVRESGNRRPVGGWLPQVTQMPADANVISTLPSCPKSIRTRRQ